jgi:uroporphyrinogen-III decarboxylase
MSSRQRVLKAINHQEPDRIPIDLGGSIVSGIMAGALVQLRHHLGLDERRVKVTDQFQMLGEVAPDLVERLALDVLPVEPQAISFNLRNQDFKPWTLFDGTEILVPGDFAVDVTPEGHWLMHNGGDPNQPVVARMPHDGFYFDMLDITQWNPDYEPPALETFRSTGWRRLKDEDLHYLQELAQTLRSSTNKALLLANWGEATLGPAVVGSIPEWLVLLVTEPDYVRELMDLAAEIAIENLALYWQALGENIDIIALDGFDFGAQRRELFSPGLFEDLYEPCYKVQCEWIHQHTPWKVFKHCCGSIPNLIEPMIRAEIDILNPVQTSAAGMDPGWLKETFGDRITFWGGGVDTQNVLPFGTPGEIYEHVAERLRVFGPGGGFVWSAVHNIQYQVPPENIMAAFQAVHDLGQYPIN